MTSTFPLTAAVAEGHRTAETPLTRLQKIEKLRQEKAAATSSDKVPQVMLEATTDESGDIIIRIPTTVDQKFIGPTSTDKNLIVKYAVIMPKDTVIECEWPKDGNEVETRYHRVGGDGVKGNARVNLNLIIGMLDDLAPSVK